MNKNDSSALDAAALVELRKSLRDNVDAPKIIIEKLGAGQMGPADFMRTKREAQEFMRNGTLAEAAQILQNARERVAWKETQSQRLSERQGHGMSP